MSEDLGNPVLFSTPPTDKGTVIHVHLACAQGLCSCEHFIGGIRAQLLSCRFASELFKDNHTERGESWELFQGVTDGFDIVDRPVDSYDCTNYGSITSGPAREVMEHSVAEELSEGRISITSEKPTCIHSLGAVPKSKGGYRTITDCSRPESSSVNSCSGSLAPKFKFKSIDDVVDQLSEGAFMAVIDIKSAYRAVPINPDHWTYQGFRWGEEGDEKTYIDHRMCFGVRTGPYYFNLISNFIYETASALYDIRMVNYLDDFIVICDSRESCLEAQSLLVKFVRSLGFHISWQKVTPPANTVQYLGIIVDSIRMELRMPNDKLEKLRSLLRKHNAAKFITKRDLESLTGLLAHCSHCVKGGCTFCRRLYDLYKLMVNKDLHRARITNIVREDIRWWDKFCKVFNGTSAINNELHPHDIYTDASKEGFGAHLDTDWLVGTWHSPLELKTDHGHVVSAPTLDIYNSDNINELELSTQTTSKCTTISSAVVART